MTQKPRTRSSSAWSHNGIAAIIWLAVITSGVIVICEDVNQDSRHYPIGFASPMGTIFLVAVLVAIVLFSRRIAALFTGMTVAQRKRLDPWRADRIAAAGFALVVSTTIISQVALGEGFIFGENIVVAILTSIVCVQPVIELVQRNRLVHRCAAENKGGWIGKTRIGVFVTRCAKLLRD